MAVNLIQCVEVEFELERVLLGEAVTLRGGPDAHTDERINLLQVSVIVLGDRDIWFEFEMRRRLSTPGSITFVLRFTAEDGLPGPCEATLSIDGKRFSMPVDDAGHATCVAAADDVLDPKSKRVRKPIHIALDCSG